ncbi:phosphatidate cytidylyltransferase [Lentisphaerota bacterium ZTH]|nr:phosphatidate cytidylyltransferase [Lentisphaerota bacterium]WET06378.1 phosphatidate cytidylyltransferase [Lentisphaerota bacterium ZTH]
MFIFRAFSFVILITVFLIAILWQSKWAWLAFSAIGTVAAFMVVCEMLTMLYKAGRSSYKIFSAIAAAATVLLIFLRIPLEKVVLVPTFYVMALWIYMLISREREKVLPKVITSTGGTLMALIPLCFLAAIYVKGEGSTYEGRYLLLYLVLVTKTGDTFAYITGMLSNKILKGGNHKIVPNISPKKSWEGAVGGMIFSIIISYVLSLTVLHDSSLAKPLIAGIILFWGGFYGDLAESSVKRACGVKDSGAIIPGMGGAYDVLDSLMFNAPLFFAYMLLV